MLARISPAQLLPPRPAVLLLLLLLLLLHARQGRSSRSRLLPTALLLSHHAGAFFRMKLLTLGSKRKSDSVRNM